jgi:hypothetical protein
MFAALLIAAALGPCTHAQLDVRLGRTDGTAGSFYTPIIFTNTGDAACTLRGYPGVSSANSAHGAQRGHSATRDPGSVKTVTLKAHATATLRTVDTGVFDPARCHAKAVKGLRIYAPNQTVPFFHPHRHSVCTTGRSGLSVTPAG